MYRHTFHGLHDPRNVLTLGFINAISQMNQLHCARFTDELFSKLLICLNNNPYLTIETDLGRIGTGEPCCRITMQFDRGALNGYSICIFFSIGRHANCCPNIDQLPSNVFPPFRPSECDVRLISPNGEIYCNLSIGYPYGEALFRGDLDSIAEQLGREICRLKRLTEAQLLGEDEQPHYEYEDGAGAEDEPPPYYAVA